MTGIGNGSVALANVTITGGTVSNVSGVVPTPFTANGVVYASSTSALATGSALTFDGTNFGLGVTPSAWNTTGSTRAFEFQNGLGSGSAAGWFGSVNFLNNAFLGGGIMRYVATGVATQYQQVSGAHQWFTAPSGTAGNAITFTQAMSLDASGNLLVGKTSAGNAINGAQLSSTYQFFTNTSDYISIFNRRGTDGISVYFQKAETNVGNISVTTSATAYNTSSDYRLKNITGALTGAKDFIMSLQPKQGTWKADGSKFVGFLAHEFQEVSPSSVTGEKDAVDADGKPIMQSMQASSSEVMANLISLVQEQQAIIESLKARLDAANL